MPSSSSGSGPISIPAPAPALAPEPTPTRRDAQERARECEGGRDGGPLDGAVDVRRWQWGW